MNVNIYFSRACALVILFCTVGFSLLTAQSRDLSNCKAGTPDEIGAVFKDFFQDGSTPSWLFESGGTFVENADGSADLTAVLAQYPLPSARRFQVAIHYISKTCTAPSGSPVLMNTQPSTQGWYYYDWGTATLTGLSDLEGAQLTLTKRGKAPQMGLGGADQAADINKLGMSAWLNWAIVSQPNNLNIRINDFPDNPSMDQGDLCMTFSGEPTPCNNACIGGQTFCDNNNNGILDAGDAVATNLVITLFDSNFNVLSTQAVGADGKYTFNNLAAGTYNIAFPTATLDGKPLTTSSPLTIALAVGEQRKDVNAGYYSPPPPLGCIGGQTFCDNNNNGILDAGDAVATNLVITLFDVNFNVLSTQAVDADGKYTFNNLVAGTYNIAFPTATLDGKPLTTSSPLTIALAVGEQRKDVNAGYYLAPPALGCIGGQTYCDNNNNGILDAGDTPLSNLTISLCDAGFNPITGVSPIAVGADGKYNFTNLPAGVYNVKFPTATLDGKLLTTASPINVNLTAGEQKKDVNAGYFKPVPVCSAIFDPNKCYKIVNLNSGLGLDVSGASKSNDASVIQYPYGGAANQQWQIVPTTNGFVKIVARHSGKMLACHNAANGSKVYQYDFYTGGAKEWKIECTTGGNYRLIHRLSGRVLEVPSASKTQNTQMQVYDWKGGTNQQFQIEEVACAPIVQPCTPTVCVTNKANCSINIYLINGSQKTHVKSLTAGQSYTCAVSNGQLYRACNASTGASLSDFTVNGCGAQNWNVVVANTTCQLTFYSKCNASVKIYTVNNYGQKVFYKTLYANQSCSQSTSFGAKWIVCNASGNTISSYQVSKYGSSWCNIYSNYGTWNLNNADVLTLDARQLSGRTTLNWTNNTGFKNDYFAVQRLNNATGVFEDLKTLNNFQDSDEMALYTEYDDAPQADENTYRIKLSQYDGMVQYSELKTVKTGKFENVRLFPNPAVGIVNIDVSQFENRKVTLYLYNRMGQIVKNQIIENASKAPFQWNIENEKSGNYLLRVTSEGKRDVTKQLIITE